MRMSLAQTRRRKNHPTQMHEGGPPVLTLGGGGTAPAATRLPLLDLYPKREEPRHHWLDPAEAVERYVTNRLQRPVFRLRLRFLLWQVLFMGRGLDRLDDSALDAHVMQLRSLIRRHGLNDRGLSEAFALIHEVSRRTLGLYHYKVQVLGALALARGAIAEMETGEGKTLTATLAVGAAALAGIPVHVITVNDYLAKRDADTMRPLFNRLGLSLGILEHGMQPDARRAAYASDILYTSNKEIAFDYQRDRVKLGGPPPNTRLKVRQFFAPHADKDPLVMNSLHFAVVNEADSVLIDEARTPLILSREADAEAEKIWAYDAHRLAGALFEKRDFILHTRERRVELTPAVKNRWRRGRSAKAVSGKTASGVSSPCVKPSPCIISTVRAINI